MEETIKTYGAKRILLAVTIICALLIGFHAYACAHHLKLSSSKLKQGKTDTTAKSDNECDIETRVKVFKDVLYCRSTTVGLNGSNACFSLKTANIPKTFTTWIQKGRNTPFQNVYWYATDKQEHLDDLSIVVIQSKSEPGSVVITLVPRPRYQPGAEVKIVLVGVEAGK